jgi:hypothetical protein
MGYKLWDYVCVCGAECECLTAEGEVALCAFCGEAMTRQPFTQGTAARAEVNPAKTREMFSKARHMVLRTQNRLPWRRSSYSQSGNE